MVEMEEKVNKAGSAEWVVFQSFLILVFQEVAEMEEKEAILVPEVAAEADLRFAYFTTPQVRLLILEIHST